MTGSILNNEGGNRAHYVATQYFPAYSFPCTITPPLAGCRAGNQGLGILYEPVPGVLKEALPDLQRGGTRSSERFDSDPACGPRRCMALGTCAATLKQGHVRRR